MHAASSDRARAPIDVMRQIAGRGQERRPAIFVAAIAGDRVQRRQRGADLGAVRIGEGERKHPQRFVDVFALAEPRADDHAGDAGLIEDEAPRDIGHGRRGARPPMRPPSARAGAPPSRRHAQEARRTSSATTCRMRSQSGSSLPSHVRSEPAAGHGTVGEQAHAVLGVRRTRPRRADRAARTTPDSSRSMPLATAMRR